ncbi:DUF6907 domain-containing protein [Streptomyces ossamyceticus]|uniref:DUF6907 domain-containing protein n=1 Tax=Streptomyces ossamyceticus TaxID=249581 RepID=UPI003441730E
MTGPRTVTVPTSDRGEVTLVCPTWCVGEHEPDGYRTDLFHESAEQQLTLPVRGGTVELLAVAFESRPFTEGWTGTTPFVNVGFSGDYHPVRVDGLEAMADALEQHAATLREYAHQLAVLLAGGAR